MYIQKFLREGGPLDDLMNPEKYNLIVKEYGKLVIFNYRQIGSLYDNISIEARGLILEKDTWNKVHVAFNRFFNDNEKENICGVDKNFKNRSNLYILEKLDGSLFGVFIYMNDWMISTRGVIGADCPISFGNIETTFTFEKYFNEIVNKDEFFKKLNPNYDYTFEIAGPKNIIVTPYDKEKEGLYLICLRKKPEFKECNYTELKIEAERIGTKYPNRISDTNILKQNILIMDSLDEGYVCVDYFRHYDGLNYPRVKIKNLNYLIRAKEKRYSMKDLFGLILLNKDNEYIAKFNYDENIKIILKELKQKYITLLDNIHTDFNILKELYPNSKEFGKSNIKTKYNDFIFKLYANVPPKQYIDTLIDNNGLRYTAKKLINLF